MSALAQHAEAIARALLGEPNRHLSSKSQLRFGAHGSVAVEIGGHKVGTWYDHEAGSGGGLLDLIVRERGGTRRDAIDWIESLGIELDSGNGAAGPPHSRVAEYIYHDPSATRSIASCAGGRRRRSRKNGTTPPPASSSAARAA